MNIDRDKVKMIALLIAVIVCIAGMVAVALLAGGCTGTSAALQPTEVQVAGACGRLIVYGALKSDAVNELDLAIARPYLVYVRNIVEAAPQDAPVAVLDAIEAEAAQWGASLEDVDRALILDSVRVFIEAVRVEGDRTVEEERAAVCAVALIDGMIAAIDVAVPRP